jgi:putative FmdB family regulatory protein
MPLYEYHCDDCGREFELIRKFSDPPLEACPHCGGAVRKLFSSPAIQFKGSGFYITDYAKKDSGPAGSSSEPKSDSASNEKDAREKRGDKTEKGDKAEKSEKAGKTDKADKSDKTEKPGKADTAGTKTETAAAVKTPAKKDTP